MSLFFFAWTDESSVFGSDMLREDEQIVEFEIEHEEGDFPALRIDVVNPRVGLLAAGRNLWCWLSWLDEDVGAIQPLFHGRLIGIPENLHGEVVRLLFVARPSDYIARKTALAESLKTRPYWDPAWISEGEADPDTAWEARPESVHIDRVSLAVTSSNLVIGEDGTVTINADEHLYDDMEIGFAETPLRRVNVKATATWQQEGEGVVDLTQAMVNAFQTAGSPYLYPMIGTFTPGLIADWPEAGTRIGAGWEMDATASIGEAVWALAWLRPIVYLKVALASEEVVDRQGSWSQEPGGAGISPAGSNRSLQWRPAITHQEDVATGWDTYAVIFPIVPYEINFTVKWTASRPRTEILTFTLTADTQPLLVDPGDDEEDSIELSSDLIDEAVDPGGAMPIGDARRNSYFNTDRGAQTVEFLIMLARARILARARAVNLTVTTRLATATLLSCRYNVVVLDDRLPDGQAAGKVKKYVLSGSGDSGEFKAEITIGCTVGKANTVIAQSGENVYIDDYINGYYAEVGATIDPGTSDVTYQSFDDLDVLDDDGVDLFRMTPDRVVSALTIAGGANEQMTALNIFQPYNIEPNLPDVGDPSYNEPFDPTAVLTGIPTVVTLTLVPIGTQSFQTEYEPTVSALMVPKTIDLEAA